MAFPGFERLVLERLSAIAIGRGVENMDDYLFRLGGRLAQESGRQLVHAKNTRLALLARFDRCHGKAGPPGPATPAGPAADMAARAHAAFEKAEVYAQAARLLIALGHQVRHQAGVGEPARGVDDIDFIDCRFEGDGSRRQ